MLLAVQSMINQRQATESGLLSLWRWPYICLPVPWCKRCPGEGVAYPIYMIGTITPKSHLVFYEMNSPLFFFAWVIFFHSFSPSYDFCLLHTNTSTLEHTRRDLSCFFLFFFISVQLQQGSLAPNKTAKSGIEVGQSILISPSLTK